MEDKELLHALQLIQSKLVKLDVNHVVNSIGSHIFLDFGDSKELVSKNGKTFIEREWTIWVGSASWRVTRNDKYIFGSGEPNIQLAIEKLVGKKFNSIRFISQFLDVEFCFEDDIKLTTFFNWRDEDQWVLFLPNKTAISINCSTDAEIGNIQKLSKSVVINNTYKNEDVPKIDSVVSQIFYNENDLPIFRFSNEMSIHLEACTWRLEKNNDYVTGYLDANDNLDNKNILLCLSGMKIKDIRVANSMYDSEFIFEDQYVLKTFTCSPKYTQWKICLKDIPIFEADIKIEGF